MQLLPLVRRNRSIYAKDRLTRCSLALAVSVLLTGACDTVANICDTDPGARKKQVISYRSPKDALPNSTVDVGYGQGEFISFEPQQDLPVEFGPQGGSTRG